MDKHTLDAVFASLSSASAAPLPLSNGFADMYQEFVDAQVGPDDAKPSMWSRMARAFSQLTSIADHLAPSLQPSGDTAASR